MPQCAPLSMLLHVIYEIYFIRGGRVLLSKLPFPGFGKLYLTDIEGNHVQLVVLAFYM